MGDIGAQRNDGEILRRGVRQSLVDQDAGQTASPVRLIDHSVVEDPLRTVLTGTVEVVRLPGGIDLSLDEDALGVLARQVTDLHGVAFAVGELVGGVCHVMVLVPSVSSGSAGAFRNERIH